jgi:hypothetical protein
MQSAIEGLEITKDTFLSRSWELSGFPKTNLNNYETAYDFEKIVQKNIDCTGITFDSEYSMFCVYAKSKKRLVLFAEQIAEYCSKESSKTKSNEK